MKASVIILYVLLAVLTVIIYMQFRAIKKLASIVTPPISVASADREIPAGEWTKQLSDKLQQMNVELKF